MGILDRDRKILWARAHNSCAYCKRSLVEDATGDDGESVVGDEAHIVAQSGRGPRAGLIPDGDVDLYGNLILLCKVHHKLVDDQPTMYTVEHLQTLKRDHEQWAERRFRLEGDTIPHVGEADSPEIVSRVPETASEIDHVLGHRPWSWEYLLYAGSLQVGLHAAKQQEGHRHTSSMHFRNKAVAIQHVRVLMRELTAIVEEVMNCFEPERLSRALGEPGRPGEFRLIHAVANQLVDTYVKLMRWSIAVRYASVPRQTRRLFEIVSRMADRPMSDIEAYSQGFAASLNDALRQAAAGRTEPLVLTATCTVTADEGLFEAFGHELKRIS